MAYGRSSTRSFAGFLARTRAEGSIGDRRLPKPDRSVRSLRSRVHCRLQILPQLRRQPVPVNPSGTSRCFPTEPTGGTPWTLHCSYARVVSWSLLRGCSCFRGLCLQRQNRTGLASRSAVANRVAVGCGSSPTGRLPASKDTLATAGPCRLRLRTNPDRAALLIHSVQMM